MNKNIQAIYPLTPMQEGILYHTIEMPDADIYFQQFSCVIEGLHEPKKWQQSWQEVAQNHPIMRTLFTWENRPQPLQIVRERVTLPWTELDWSELSSSQQDTKWTSLTQRDRDLNFDMSIAPLMRFTLVNLGQNRHHFLFSFHHILLDGWSQRLLFEQAVSRYKDQALVDHSSENSNKTTYSDFIDWLGLQDKTAAKTFWSNNLAGFEQPTNIVNDSSSANPVVSKLGRQELVINPDIVEKLNVQTKNHRLTLNSLFLGAWSLILASHNHTQDVVFGTTVAGRPSDLPHADKIAGLFINTLPFRAHIDQQLTLAEWLAKLQSSQAACRQFEQTPLTDIQRYSELNSGTPLFESILVFENLPTVKSSGNDNELLVSQLFYTEFSHYPLAILVDPSDGLNLIALYQESKISAKRVSDVLKQLNTVLIQMSESLDTHIAKITTFPRELKQQTLAHWNQTKQRFPEALPVHQMFEKWAANTPDNIAIIDVTSGQQNKFSYAQVNKQANQLANHLRTKSLKPNSIVPVLLERSASSLISFLAVMKTGAAYIPLDSNQPAERNAAVIATLKDDNLLVISQNSLKHKLLPSASTNQSPNNQTLNSQAVSVSPNIICIDECQTDIENCSIQNLDLKVELQHLAYVIYTSGSTGVPKGVMIEHKALVNSTLARKSFYPCEPETFLLMSSLATDSSIAGIYWTLCSGNTLLLPANRIEQDMLKLGQIINRNNVSHMLCIPSLYQLILENADNQDLQCLSTVIVAGESCNQSVIQQHQKHLPNTELYNEYGPSECCVWATAARLTDWQVSQRVSIGRPISNTEVFVLNQNLDPVLPEVVGELYIGGDNLARGYLNQETGTAKVFIRNPFVDNDSSPTLYKTGDLVKYTTGGDLIYIGRADNQVKVRGFRIEPEEIEYVLSCHPLVEEALVFVETPPASEAELLNALLTLNDSEAGAILADIENAKIPNATLMNQGGSAL